MAAIAPEITEPPIASHSEELYLRVRAYLAAWRIGDTEWVEDCARELAGRAAQRLHSQAGLTPECAAIEEAEAFLRDWFGAGDTAGVPIETRLALALGSPPGEFRFSDRIQNIAALRQGELNAACALTPARPPETRAMIMQTTLSRLPSIRLIGGWCLIVGLLVLAFFFTH